MYVRCTHSTAMRPAHHRTVPWSELPSKLKLKLSSHQPCSLALRSPTPNTTRNTPLELQQQHLQHPPSHSASLSHTQTEHTPLKYLQQCSAARSRPPCADRSRRASAQLQPLKHPSTSPSAPSAMLPVCSIPPDARGRLSASLAVRSSVP